MRNKNETDSLNELILVMEKKHANDLELFKEQFHVVYNSLRPVNLIKGVFQDVTASSEIKNNLVNNAMGLGAGFLLKKILLGNSHHPVKRVLGILLQFGVTNLVSKKFPNIKSIGGSLVKSLFKKSHIKASSFN